MQRIAALIVGLTMVFTMCFVNLVFAETEYHYENKEAGTYDVFYLQRYLEERLGAEFFFRLPQVEKSKYEVFVPALSTREYDIMFYLHVDISKVSTYDCCISFFEEYIYIDI